MITVHEIIKQNENVKVVVRGCNAADLCDCRDESYYEGMLADIPKHLLDCEVLETGYSYGSKCPIILIPYQREVANK